ncbi:MAG: hypothetical protein ACLTBV_14590 [Enterocloster bolteae]
MAVTYSSGMDVPVTTAGIHHKAVTLVAAPAAQAFQYVQHTGHVRMTGTLVSTVTPL